MVKRIKSDENFFSNWGKKDLGIALVAILAIPCVALGISILIAALAGFYAFARWLAGTSGIPFLLDADMQKTAVAVAGAVCVAVLALVGVLRQNKSAEERHRMDATLSLKKDILLLVADSFAMQVAHLFSHADDVLTPEDRKELIKDGPKAFYRLQAVASAEVTAAMLDVNQAWMEASIGIMLFVEKLKARDDAQPLERFLGIIERTTPVIEMLWKFNMIARKELRLGFPDEDAYFAMMQAKWAELPRSIVLMKLDQP